MGNPPRCPLCNRFGSGSLDDYCKDCYGKRYDVTDNRSAFDDNFGDFASERPFFPDSFGVEKDKFGYER